MFKKLLFFGVLFIFVSLSMLIILLQTHGVQNHLAQRLVESLNARMRHETSLGQLKVNWFDSIELGDVLVSDYKGDTLFASEQIHLDFDLFDFFGDHQLHFNQLELSKSTLIIQNYPDTLENTLNELIDDINGLVEKVSAKDSAKEQGIALVLDYFYLDDFSFGYRATSDGSPAQGKFDFRNMFFQVHESTMHELLVSSDSIAASIGSFAAFEVNSLLDIKKFRGDLGVSKDGIVLNDFIIKTSESFLQDSLRLNFSGLGDLSFFADSVEMLIRLKGSEIGAGDLRRFIDMPGSVPNFGFSGLISGSVGSLAIRDMRLSASEKTYVTGNLDFFGLPKVKETFIDLNVSKSSVVTKELADHIPGMPAHLIDLGQVTFSGRLTGFINDFFLKLEANTRSGSLSASMNLKLPDKWQDAKYRGDLSIRNFNLGGFLHKKALFQYMDFDGSIAGEGLTIENADLDLEAKLNSLGIYGYNYSSILAKGHFSSEFFDGILNIDDPNLRLQSKAMVNLMVNPEVVQLQSDIEYVNFNALHLMEDDFIMSSNIQFDLSGISLDSLNSTTTIVDSKLELNGKQLVLDSVILKATNDGGFRHVTLNSPELMMAVDGSFLYSQVFNDSKKITKEVLKYFLVAKEEANDGLDWSENPYDLVFEVQYGDVNRYLDFMGLDAHISPNGAINGSYRQRKNATFNLFAAMDSAYWKGLGLSNNTFELDFSRDLDSQEIVVHMLVSSENQYFQGIPNTQHLEAEMVWLNDQIGFETSLQQPATKSQFGLSAEMRLLSEQIVAQVTHSKIMLLGDEWQLSPANEIVFDGSSFVFRDWLLNENDQKLEFRGIWSPSQETDLNLSINQLDVGLTDLFLPFAIGGSLNGKFTLTKKTAERLYSFNTNFKVLDFYVEDYLVGDIAGSGVWDKYKKRLGVNLDFERASFNTMELSGYYYPERGDEQLDFHLKYSDLGLRTIAPFTEGLVAGLDGLATGEVVLTGDLNSPSLAGSTHLSQGFFKYEYLGVSYGFEGDLYFDNESILIKPIILTDRDGNNAIVEGRVSHDGFRDIATSVTVKANDFHMLQTSASSGESYYGTAYASGRIDVEGPVSDLLIKADLKSEPGTKVSIPLEEDNQTTQKEYIKFVNFSDTTAHIAKSSDLVVQNSGLRLEFDLELTEDAYVEMIFDPRTGDIIKGAAEGNLKLLVDTDGAFEMFGDLTVVRGDYNFVLNVLGTTLMSKEFTIRPGGTLSWYGNPYTGILDLKAQYRQLASIKDLQDDLSTSQSESKLPVLVVLNLKGEMLAPTIDFEIQLEDDQSVTTTEKAIIQGLNINEQQLKQQVFSLLILRKFSSQDQPISTGGTAEASISEFLSNQISYYISQFSDNLEIDLDMDLASQEAAQSSSLFENMQLTLSYSFLNGRLRVSGGGGFNQQQENLEETAFIGDWAVRYLLTQDGKLRAKIFSQAEQQPTQGPQRVNGVSFQVFNSFDDLRQILPKAWTRDIRKKRAKTKD